MRKLVLIIVLIIQINQLFGQNEFSFLSSELTWTMDLQTQGSGPPYPPPISHERKNYKTSGDTIIQGLKYAIIDKPDFLNYCFIRQEDKKVYCKYSDNTLFDTSEFVLYNFSYKVNDSVALPQAGNPTHYFESVVSSVDSVLIGKYFHKKISIESWIHLDFIEGIGSLQGLMYNEIPFVDYWADLNCFSRNDTIYSVYGDGNFEIGNCWQTLDVQQIEEQSILVYPNPTNGVLLIEGETIKKAILYDLIGQKILETNFSNLNLQEMENGIYILKVIDIFDKIYSFKIIKNNVE